LPENSPYHDVSTDTRIAAFAGWYWAGHDPAGVLPKSGPLYGVRWDVHVGGPADLTFRVATVPTQRNVIDPLKAAGHRVVQVRDISLGMGDAGIAFNLTGNKSWHYLVPALHASVGVLSDFSGTDLGGYTSGTTFALGYGIGTRILPKNNRLSARVDIGNYFYAINYPDTYFAPAVDGTTVLPTTASKNGWHNNWTLTFGVTFALFK
jgi:hypothetical protein